MTLGEEVQVLPLSLTVWSRRKVGSPFHHPPPGWEVMDQRWGPATFPVTMSAHFSDSQVTLCRRPTYLGQGVHWPPRLEATYGQAKADCDT